MGLGGISIWQLLIILAIIVMVFGTSRLGTSVAIWVAPSRAFATA